MTLPKSSQNSRTHGKGRDGNTIWYTWVGVVRGGTTIAYRWVGVVVQNVQVRFHNILISSTSVVITLVKNLTRAF